MTTPLKQMTAKQLQQRSLGPLQQLADRWRVVANGIDDPVILLRGKSEHVYEIDAWRVGLWLQGRSAAWIDKFRRRFASCAVELRGDTETVLAWPIMDSRTDELLAFIGARRRRQRSSAERARLVEAGRDTRFGAQNRGVKVPNPGPESTQTEKTGSGTGQVEPRLTGAQDG